VNPQKVRSRWRSWGVPVILVLGMFAAAIAGFTFVDRVLTVVQSGSLASGDPKSVGSSSAAVELIEYADYQ
jgi:hypothetical protein